MKNRVLRIGRLLQMACLLCAFAGTLSCGGGTAQGNSSAAVHSVTLSWQASSSQVMGYYVYRGTQSGGPYARLNTEPQPATSYTDSTVQAGNTYFYVTTSVDENLVESSNSNQATATIPGS